jgi:CheY-like chemotaxis protein
MTESRLIYLVDDDADYRFLVQQIFKKFLPQHHIRFFANGAELIDNIDSPQEQSINRPDVILLDIDMPRLNGFETLLQLKQRVDWQPVPVVMMTNRDQVEFRQESKQLGASAFLLKPIELMEIKTTMTQICDHKGDFGDLSALTEHAV